MNAHQRYVANILNQLDPDSLAALVACPPGNRSSAKSAADIHGWVKDYATPETRLAWAELLAQASAVKPKGDWPSTWWTAISDMIFDIDLPAEAQVSSLDEARQAA